MNSYEISFKLEIEFGFNGDNGNQTISIMRLMRACELFGIEFDWNLAVKGSLHGHVGYMVLEDKRSVWFILLDQEERNEHKGCSIAYSLCRPPYEGDYPNGETIEEIFE